MSLWCAAAVVLSVLEAAAPIPREWGSGWQPTLPARERHPSLFFDDGEREGMRDRIKRAPYSVWWESVRRAPQKAHLGAPAFVWWMTGDEAAARQARENLVNNKIARHAKGYLYANASVLRGYVAAYDILAAWKGLSAEDHALIRRRIADEADHYYDVIETGPGSGTGNQRTLAASALGIAALVLCEYTGSRHTPLEWLTQSLYQIRREENFSKFRPGGLFVEGLGYTAYMNGEFVPFAIAYERATGKYLLDDPRLRDWLVFSAYQSLPNGEFVYWGTCESAIYQRFYALLANRRYGGEDAVLFHRLANAGPMRKVLVHDAPIAIARYEEQVSGPEPPASRAFPGSHTVVLRSGWNADSLGVWFAGKERSWGKPGRHETFSQADVGHFFLAAWNEDLANDSGYDHWKSRDFYGPEFHNVPLIDGKGPAQDTPGTLENPVTEGPVQHATVAAEFQGCAWRRTIALVRGRYVVVADRFTADREHVSQWQVRSTCPPGSPGTELGDRFVTWPGLSADEVTVHAPRAFFGVN